MSGKTYRVLIADDEPPARKRLRSGLVGFSEVDVVGEAADGIEAVEKIQRLEPDLIFLDVQMPGLNGFEVLQHLPIRPAVIFITAYDEYAIRAFDVHAVDYLLKPYGRERFQDAVAHAIERIERDADRNALARAPEDQFLRHYRLNQGYLQRISVKKGNSYHVIPVTEIDFFEAREGLIFLVRQGIPFVVDLSLNHLEQELDPMTFFRLHRSALINVTRIQEVRSPGEGRLVVIFPGGEELPVSRRRAREFRRVAGIERV